MINWTDLIICMEHIHKAELYKQFPKSREKEILVLNISNNYLRYDPELKTILKKELENLNLI